MGFYRPPESKYSGIKNSIKDAGVCITQLKNLLKSFCTSLIEIQLTQNTKIQKLVELLQLKLVSEYKKDLLEFVRLKNHVHRVCQSLMIFFFSHRLMTNAIFCIEEKEFSGFFLPANFVDP